MYTLFILLQDAAADGGSSWFNMVFFVGIIAIFYFFMIRPQQKRAKQEKKFRENLEKGDKVLTVGGIHGIVESIEEDSVLLKVDNSTKLRMEKSSLRAAPSTAEASKSN
jgi:preprotein translocase subunit YajC